MQTQFSLSHSLRYLICTAVAVAAPTFLYLLRLEPLEGLITFRNSVMAALIATLIALMGQSRLSSFPGVSAAASIFPAFAAGFGVVTVSFLITRLPYSNVFLLVSFTFSLAAALFLALRTPGKLQLHIVPGGNVDRLFVLDNVQIVRLDEARLPAIRRPTIVADLHYDHEPKWEAMLARAALQGIPVYHFKNVLQSLTGRVQIEHLSENIYGSLMPNMGYLSVKRVFDTLLAVISLPFLLALFFVVGILVRLDSPGPSIFTQKRTGYRGEQFLVYKFRTMRLPSDSCAQDRRRSAMTKDNDERITRLGQFLRRTRIDELPQVFNILKGEMSWIGPRPEAVDLAEWYEEELPFYSYRHIVRPGITGWAQVNQGHVTDVEDIQHKLQYDFFYIANFSYWIDILIIARSILVVFTGFGAR